MKKRGKGESPTSKAIIRHEWQLPEIYPSNLVERGLALASEIKASVSTLPKAREVRRFVGHKDRVRSLSFSPDGKWLASGSADQTVRLWDLGGVSEHRVLTGHSSEVYCVEFSHDGRHLLTGDWHGKIIVWDLKSGAELRRFLATSKKTFDRPYWYVTGIKALKDASRAIVLGGDNFVRLWDYSEAREISVFRGAFESIWEVYAFSENGSKFLTAGLVGGMHLWVMGDGGAISSTKIIDSNVDDGFTISRDGRLIAYRNLTEPQIVLFDVDKMMEFRRLPFTVPVKRPAKPVEDPDALTEAYLILDEGALETIVDVSDYMPIDDGAIDSDGFVVSALAISKDDRFLIGGTSAGCVFCTDILEGRVVWEKKAHQGSVGCISISQNGNLMASGGHDDNEIALWSLG